MTVITGRHLCALVVSGILIVGSWPNLKAQDSLILSTALERELARAEANVYSHTDSVIAFTNRLVKRLEKRGQVDTPFGLRVQLTQASAFEKDEQDGLALQKLLRVEQLSREKKLWETHARTCLMLSLMYEKNELKEQSRQQLDLAKADIDRYGLNAVYPRFAVRMSSWQRQFNDKDSALFFARQAVRTAPKYGLISEEADGAMLISFLTPKSHYKEKLQSLLKAKSFYQKMGDERTVMMMCDNIAHIHFDAKAFSLALLYCDSAIIGANQLIAIGKKIDGTWIGMRSYTLRGEIYQQLGKLNLALADIKRGHELALNYQDLEAIHKIKEIDVRYQTQLNKKQIKDQQFALQLKNNQLRFSVIIVLLVIILAVGLFIAYRKQRQARRKLTEQNTLIQQQATQLKSLDRAKSHFFANVSHELRTPLTLLLGPVSTLLAENRLTDKQTHLLQLAHRSGNQLGQLITDILDLGKLELGKLELDERPTPLAAFFRSHFAQFESLAESRHLHYSFDIQVADEVVVNLDQPRCRQILSNLLSNAFKFTPAGGRITTSLTLTGGRLHLNVADTGQGIHPNDLPYLFDRYFQTTRPNKPAEGGTGIGLALCREYAQLFGGKIDVESRLGIGSIFRVEFPVVRLPADDGGSHGETPVSLPTVSADVTSSSLRVLTTGETDGAIAAAKPTILVVEDNPDLQAYIRLILSDAYAIVTAENGQAALNRLQTDDGRASTISLILSDLMMPVVDGHQLLEALKSDDATRHIPVIMLTARADRRDKLRALRIGVDDYLLKPFDEAELLARINNLLANHATRLQAVTDEPQPDLPHQVGQPFMSQADQEWLETFEGYVQEHLADPMLTVPELAHEFAMSESTLLRKLKRLTGLSPLQYVQVVRLEEARRLLESRHRYSVAQVAAKVGYDNSRSFSQTFRARFGKLPSELLET